MDKSALLAQVTEALRRTLDVARRTAGDAREAATNVATAQEKKADARVGLELGALATGHDRRAQKLQAELEALANVPLRRFGQREPVAVGAVVEVEDGAEGRTFFVLPVGAGSEIAGPGGDGVLTVVSAASPMGRAVMGRRVGESVEVAVQGEPREWTITYVG